MITVLRAAAAVLALKASFAAAAPPPAAELRALGTATTEMRARVEEAPGGYRLVIRCESGCPGPIEFTEAIRDVPLGLFQIWDGDGLLVSTWAGGSAYVVRVHLMTPSGIRLVLEAASRSAPGFALDAHGRMTVTTGERLGGPRDGLRTIVWGWDGTLFQAAGSRGPHGRVRPPGPPKAMSYPDRR